MFAYAWFYLWEMLEECKTLPCRTDLGGTQNECVHVCAHAHSLIFLPPLQATATVAQVHKPTSDLFQGKMAL